MAWRISQNVSLSLGKVYLYSSVIKIHKALRLWNVELRQNAVCSELRQNAVCSDSYDRMQSVQTVTTECSLFRQLWQNAVCSVTTECSLFSSYDRMQSVQDSYDRMPSVQTVTTECSLFRQLRQNAVFRQLWQNAVCSDSYLRLKGTWLAGQKIQQNPPSRVLEELKSHLVSQEIPAFTGTQSFFTTFTRTYQCTTSWTTKMLFTSS
jgi:hypothetical protein